eukprot:GEMP01000905.1.p1 GENE.GEMP01000905.1~~GEMP01000905.1.p1  ORF type:complete len:761 (+),score=120.82 GEMP01000905.1:206-2488(+)
MFDCTSPRADSFVSTPSTPTADRVAAVTDADYVETPAQTSAHPKAPTNVADAASHLFPSMDETDAPQTPPSYARAAAFRDDADETPPQPFFTNVPCNAPRRKTKRKAAVATTTPVVHHHPPKDTSAAATPVKTGKTLLIAYFPWEASKDDISNEFSKVCNVKKVQLVREKQNSRPRCFGFVKFMSRLDADLALDASEKGLITLNDSRGHVWHLKAEWAKTGDMVDDGDDTVPTGHNERRARPSTQERCAFSANRPSGSHIGPGNLGTATGEGGKGKHSVSAQRRSDNPRGSVLVDEASAGKGYRLMDDQHTMPPSMANFVDRAHGYSVNKGASPHMSGVPPSMANAASRSHGFLAISRHGEERPSRANPSNYSLGFSSSHGVASTQMRGVPLSMANPLNYGRGFPPNSGMALHMRRVPRSVTMPIVNRDAPATMVYNNCLSCVNRNPSIVVNADSPLDALQYHSPNCALRMRQQENVTGTARHNRDNASAEHDSSRRYRGANFCLQHHQNVAPSINTNAFASHAAPNSSHTLRDELQENSRGARAPSGVGFFPHHCTDNTDTPHGHHSRSCVNSVTAGENSRTPLVDMNMRSPYGSTIVHGQHAVGRMDCPGRFDGGTMEQGGWCGDFTRQYGARDSGYVNAGYQQLYSQYDRQYDAHQCIGQYGVGIGHSDTVSSASMPQNASMMMGGCQFAGAPPASPQFMGAGMVMQSVGMTVHNSMAVLNGTAAYTPSHASDAASLATSFASFAGAFDSTNKENAH